MLGPNFSFEARARVVTGPLAALAQSLADDLDRLLPDEDVFIPPEKARMTRKGGRCERDGTFLEFDPRSPRRQRCLACGSVFDADEHYRWWIMGYQLWLSERAVHAAALARLTDAGRYRRLSTSIVNRPSPAGARMTRSPVTNVSTSVVSAGKATCTTSGVATVAVADVAGTAPNASSGATANTPTLRGNHRERTGGLLR